MSVIVTVRAVKRGAEVFRFPIDQGEPGGSADWQLVATVEPGETRNFYAHSRKAILVQAIPDIIE